MTWYHLFVQVDKGSSPEAVGDTRTKKQTSIILSAVEKKSTVGEKHAMLSRYGLRDNCNPLFKLSVDLHRYVVSGPDHCRVS